MKTIVRVIKRSRPHFNTRSLVYVTFNGGKSEVPADKHNRFILAVGWWNELFKIKYGDFRDGVEDICEEYNKNCKFDITVKHIDALHAIGSFDGWVFSVDEDNLIDPLLSVKLKNYSDTMCPVKWLVNRVGSSHKQVIWSDLTPNVLPAGGYAFPANDWADKIHFLCSHGAATKYIDYFKQLHDEPVGLVMVHPSSHGVLWKQDNKNDVKKLVDGFLNKKKLINVSAKYNDAYSKIIKLYESL